MRVIIVDNKVIPGQVQQDPDTLIPEICQKLHIAGYEVKLAQNAQALYAALEEKPEDITVVVMDVHLNDDTDEDDLSGISLAKEVREKRADVGIIAWSKMQWEVVREALIPRKSGISVADTFVAKEEGINLLVALIEDVFSVVQRRIEEQKVIIGHLEEQEALARRSKMSVLRVLFILSLFLYVVGIILGAWIWVNTVNASITPDQAQALTPLSVALVTAAAAATFYNIIDERQSKPTK